MKTFFIAFALVSTLVTFLVAVQGFLKKESFTGNRIFFLLYFLIAAITEALTMFMFYKKWNNATEMNVFAILQLFLLAMALTPMLAIKMFKSFSYITLAIILAFSLYRLFLLDGKIGIDLQTLAIQSVYMILLSGIILFKLSFEIEIPIFKNPDFWFTVAVFFFFLINSIVFSTTNFIATEENSAMESLWVINLLISILANLCYYKAIRCLPKARI